MLEQSIEFLMLFGLFSDFIELELFLFEEILGPFLSNFNFLEIPAMLELYFFEFGLDCFQFALLLHELYLILRR